MNVVEFYSKLRAHCLRVSKDIGSACMRCDHWEFCYRTPGDTPDELVRLTESRLSAADTDNVGQDLPYTPWDVLKQAHESVLAEALEAKRGVKTYMADPSHDLTIRVKESAKVLVVTDF